MNVFRRVGHVANATDGRQQLVDQTVPARNRCGRDVNHVIRLEDKVGRHHQRGRIRHIQLVDVGHLAAVALFGWADNEDAAGV